MSKKKHQDPRQEPTSDELETPFSLEDLSLEGFDPEALEAWAENENGREDTEDQILDGSETTWKTPIRKRLGLIVLIVLTVLAIISCIAGSASRKEWPDWLAWLPTRGKSEITLIDSQNGRVLMTEVTGDLRRVVVETGSEASWLVVSRDDNTATNPAFSPRAERVAYVSEQNDGQIVIASVTEDERLAIAANAVEIAALEEDFSRVHICSWTSIAWAPDSQRVAFFGCRKLLPLSLVVVADVSGSEAAVSVIPATEAESSDRRQLQWLDESNLTVITPSSSDSPAQVQTYPVP